jgi:hypothetical protein
MERASFQRGVVAQVQVRFVGAYYAAGDGVNVLIAQLRPPNRGGDDLFAAVHRVEWTSPDEGDGKLRSGVSQNFVLPFHRGRRCECPHRPKLSWGADLDNPRSARFRRQNPLDNGKRRI